MNKISVVIPTHNRKKLLKRTIESLISQTLSKSESEIIIVDDGSTDRTEEYVKNTIKKSRVKIKYIRNAISKGPAAVRNIGIKNASGKILAFTDDDCVPDKDWLENALAYFNNKKVVGVEGLTYSKKKHGNAPVRLRREHYLAGYMTCNMFYRKDVLIRVGLFDETFGRPLREDTDIAWRVIEEGEIPFAKDVRVYHPPVFKNKVAASFMYDVLLAKKHPKKYKEFVKYNAISKIPQYIYGTTIGMLKLGKLIPTPYYILLMIQRKIKNAFNLD